MSISPSTKTTTFTSTASRSDWFKRCSEPGDAIHVVLTSHSPGR